MKNLNVSIDTLIETTNIAAETTSELLTVAPDAYGDERIDIATVYGKLSLAARKEVRAALNLPEPERDIRIVHTTYYPKRTERTYWVASLATARAWAKKSFVPGLRLTENTVSSPNFREGFTVEGATLDGIFKAGELTDAAPSEPTPPSWDAATELAAIQQTATEPVASEPATVATDAFIALADVLETVENHDEVDGAPEQDTPALFVVRRKKNGRVHGFAGLTKRGEMGWVTSAKSAAVYDDHAAALAIASESGDPTAFVEAR